MGVGRRQMALPHVLPWWSLKKRMVVGRTTSALDLFKKGSNGQEKQSIRRDRPETRMCEIDVARLVPKIRAVGQKGKIIKKNYP